MQKEGKKAAGRRNKNADKKAEKRRNKKTKNAKRSASLRRGRGSTYKPIKR